MIRVCVSALALACLCVGCSLGKKEGATKEEAGAPPQVVVERVEIEPRLTPLPWEQRLYWREDREILWENPSDWKLYPVDAWFKLKDGQTFEAPDDAPLETTRDDLPAMRFDPATGQFTVDQ